MPTATSNRRGKQRQQQQLSEKLSSFHGKPSAAMATKQLHWPSKQPNLLSNSGCNTSNSSENRCLQPTKLLLNVMMLGSFGPVHVVMSMDSTVEDLIASAVRQYVKEGRRPVLPTTDPAGFDLHYSQFCLDCLGREEKLVSVRSRNFLLCPKKDPRRTAAASSSCSEQAGKAMKTSSPWLRFMDFLL